MDAREWLKERKYWFCLANLGVLAEMVNSGTLHSKIVSSSRSFDEGLEGSYKREQGLPSYERRLQSMFLEVKFGLEKQAIEEAFKLLQNDPQNFQRCVTFIQEVFGGEISCFCHSDSRSTVTCDKCSYGVRLQHLQEIKQAVAEKYEEIKAKK
ncbi:hypothetical protein KJ934_03005 [Patescibacteria group bacterium]|nr:hypothetical protein [Patescibacteria group bacterium]MBU4353238.1 hypothetical protein [Patescibacteria group bacterium]MBU4477134.1 hypothetical protein [Patescibacteria group bacterium]MCG2698937.1 hypothetical protein [Candidatus Parcubacteria bacterium]